MKTSRPLAAFLIGLLGTLLILIAFWIGLDPRTELRALDMRFGLTDAALLDDILQVDIDDGSLELVGRWPWPRQKLASIINVLKDCGAKAVMVDLILNEAQTLRFESPRDAVYAGNDEEILSEAPPQPVFDDDIFASSLARAKNVFLAMHVDPASEASLTSEIYDDVSQFMSDNPGSDLDPVLKSFPKEARVDTVKKAYLYHRSLTVMEKFAIPANCVGALNIRSGRMTPPLVRFAIPAAGAGCVTYLPDADKLVRRSPLFFRGSNRIYPQFAVAMALHELASRHRGIASMKSDKSSFTIRCKDGTRRMVPLDSNGCMVIRWPRKAIGTSTYGLDHISAGAVVHIWREKEARRLNAARIQGLRVRFLTMRKEEVKDKKLEAFYWRHSTERAQFDEAYSNRLSNERKLQRTALYTPSKAMDSELLVSKSRQIETDIQKHLEDDLASLTAKLREPGNLEVFLGKPPSSGTTQPAEDSPDQQAFLKALTRARELLAIETELQQENLRIESNIRLLMDKLRPKVANKICMLGATSTGVPDFVPTPLGPNTPGVIVHTNIINTILSGSFVYPAGMWTNTIVIILTGVLVSLLAATRPILQAAPLSLLAAVGYVLFNVLVVFAWWSIWLAFVAPLGAMLVSFLFVTGFRQLTEERAKRQIRGMFAQALSPALVDRLLSDPSLASLGGRKTELTCMFSDLAGFTPLSESLGAHETVALLNRYFDGVTDIVQNQCGGYLNKFLGDGVFVLFGAPVTQPDHPSKAVDAALLCQIEVEKLNEELAAELGGKVELRVRIGIHSGEAMVGNCGSTQRMDYTAIGDCVNLSARLESANKFFGTRIIVSAHAWSLCDRDNLLVRPLGDVFITGVRNSLDLFEVIGPIDEIDESDRQGIAHFSDAMGLIAQRRFAEARELLQQADQLRPGDMPTEIYLDICSHCLAQGPEIEDWPAECKTAGGVVRLAWPAKRGQDSLFGDASNKES
ncbi:MAG: adenylate/guanylate cyclase domain-containing protein [Phycisphaerae bacterium]|nr:adenylate/guanylate cyclase domain-containing protein [Phycisphaerae bacterium]